MGCGYSRTTSVGANWAGTDEICMENRDRYEYACGPAMSWPCTSCTYDTIPPWCLDVPVPCLSSQTWRRSPASGFTVGCLLSRPPLTRLSAKSRNSVRFAYFILALKILGHLTFNSVIYFLITAYRNLYICPKTRYVVLI